MKTRFYRQVHFAWLLFMAVGIGLGTSQAEASTSGNATIFNKATVQYTSGTSTLTTSAGIGVTVLTLAAAPTVTVNTNAQTTTAGTTVNYVYTVRSNSNGQDTYTVTTPVTSTDTDVSPPTNTLVGNPVSLWGGIVVGSGGGFINLPGGSTTGLANNETVELTVGGSPARYTVTIANPGSAATVTNTEVLAIVILTPVGGAPSITAANVAAGTQVGEYLTVTLQQTAGTPSNAGVDGTHVTNLTFTTTATDVNNAPVVYSTKASDSNEVTTTVSSPNLAITKSADKATAKTGAKITYTITVKNNHATATATNVTVIDPVPAYTTYFPNSTQLNTITVNGDGATSPLDGGLLIDANASRAPGAVASGNLAPGETATITFQVTVN